MQFASFVGELGGAVGDGIHLFRHPFYGGADASEGLSRLFHALDDFLELAGHGGDHLFVLHLPVVHPLDAGVELLEVLFDETLDDGLHLLMELFRGLVHGLDEEVDVVFGELVSEPFDGFEQIGMVRFQVAAKCAQLGFEVFPVLPGLVAGFIAHVGHGSGQGAVSIADQSFEQAVHGLVHGRVSALCGEQDVPKQFGL